MALQKLAMLLAALVVAGGCEPPPLIEPPLYRRPDPPPPITSARRDAIVDLLVRTCPPATDSDPTPGLSAGARMPRPNGRCDLDCFPIPGLERLLTQEPAGTPDRARMLARLAEEYDWVERSAYEDCRGFVISEGNREAFAEAEREARRIANLLPYARKQHDRACRRHLHEFPAMPRPAHCAD